MNRVGKHPTLRHDPFFREFLEMDGELPKATSTSALSGAGVMRLFNRVGDSFGSGIILNACHIALTVGEIDIISSVVKTIHFTAVMFE